MKTCPDNRIGCYYPDESISFSLVDSETKKIKLSATSMGVTVYLYLSAKIALKLSECLIDKIKESRMVQR